jgi:hypothetical protein
MISISDKADCCGCQACFEACPAHCISMTADNGRPEDSWPEYGTGFAE